MHRTDILETANNLITGDRADAYGDFGEQMRGISRAFEGITGKRLPPDDIALLLQLLKLRRFETSRDHDSMIDLAGYSALRGQYFVADDPYADEVPATQEEGPVVKLGGFEHLTKKEK